MQQSVSSYLLLLGLAHLVAPSAGRGWSWRRGTGPCRGYNGSGNLTFSVIELVNPAPGNQTIAFFEPSDVTGIPFLVAGSSTCTEYRRGLNGPVSICTTVLSTTNGQLVGVADTAGVGANYAITGGNADLIGVTGEFFVEADQSQATLDGRGRLTMPFIIRLKLCGKIPKKWKLKK